MSVWAERAEKSRERSGERESKKWAERGEGGQRRSQKWALTWNSKTLQCSEYSWRGFWVSDSRWPKHVAVLNFLQILKRKTKKGSEKEETFTPPEKNIRQRAETKLPQTGFSWNRSSFWTGGNFFAVYFKLSSPYRAGANNWKYTRHTALASKMRYLFTQAVDAVPSPDGAQVVTLLQEARLIDFEWQYEDPTRTSR